MCECRGREIFRKWKIPITGFITVYHGLLLILRSFMTDITGLFLSILLTLNQDTKKASKPSHLRKPWKNRADLLRILRNITDITEIAITEYYGILWNITVYISPALVNMHKRVKMGV